METLRGQLQALLAPVIGRFALDFVDLELKGSRHHPVVRVIVDTDGGVSVDTCAALSRAVADELDMADVIPGHYRLEVSSPGVDRPLRTMRDFQRNLGREVAVRYREGETVAVIEGVIASVSETTLALAVHGLAHDIPWDRIEFGKVKTKL